MSLQNRSLGTKLSAAFGVTVALMLMVTGISLLNMAWKAFLI